MKCPNCDSKNCHIVYHSKTTGKEFSAGQGCCGYILMGPIGLLCGACGKGKQTRVSNYWVCGDCNNKFKL